MTSTAGRIVSIVCIFFLGGLCAPVAGDSALSPKCATAEHRRLDFWAGD